MSLALICVSLPFFGGFLRFILRKIPSQFLSRSIRTNGGGRSAKSTGGHSRSRSGRVYGDGENDEKPVSARARQDSLGIPLRPGDTETLSERDSDLEAGYDMGRPPVPPKDESMESMAADRSVHFDVAGRG